MKHGKILRLLSAFLSVLLVLTCLAACGGGEDTDTEAPATEGKSELMGWIIDGKNTSFTVVYPNNPAEAVSTALETLLSAFEQTTGHRPESKNDYIKRGGVRDSSAQEILFGRTGYDETADVLKTLSDGQFAIKLVGNKLVITAPKDVDLAAAVAYFTDNYLKSNLTEQDGKYLLSTADYVSEKAEKKPATINGKSLSEFSIIYESERDGYRYVAEYLQTLLREEGYELVVYKDTDRAESGAEILVGKTNRQASEMLYAEKSPKLMTYEMVASGDKLQIVSGGPFSARECVDSMRFEILAADGKDFKDTVCYKADLTAASAHSEGTTARIMTVNVLAARWGEDYSGELESVKNCPPVALRAEILAATLASTSPDVVGLQEADAKWIAALPAYLTVLKEDYGIEYTWKFYDFENKETLTSMLYRSDKYEIVSSDVENFSFWDNDSYNLRVMQWLRLRETAAPSNEFIVLNTHWAWETPESIQACVDEQTTLVNTLKGYGIPVFCTGDFNANQTTDAYNEFVTDTGAKSTRHEAATAKVQINDLGGCGSVGAVRYAGGNYIDHIFGLGTFEVLRYETLAGKNIYMTDHLPHITDVKF